MLLIKSLEYFKYLRSEMKQIFDKQGSRIYKRKTKYVNEINNLKIRKNEFSQNF